MTTENTNVPKYWKLGPLKIGGGLRELIIIGIIYGIYRVASGSIPNTEDYAILNAYKVVDVERILHIFVELDIQAFFISHKILLSLVNTLYTICYYPALFSFGFWAYLRHKDQYYEVRNVFVVSAFIAFLCFSLFPTAPPRMLADLGFIDTMKTAGSVDYSSPAARALSNPYAAMPSLHMGWTFMIGVATVLITKRRWLKIVGAMVPISMFVAIIATGNHFILDAIAGIVIIVMAYSLVKIYVKLDQKYIKKRISDRMNPE